MVKLGDARELAQARIDALGAGMLEAAGSYEAAIEDERESLRHLRLLLVGLDLNATEVAEWLQDEAGRVLEDLSETYTFSEADLRTVRQELLSMGIRVLLAAQLAR